MITAASFAGLSPISGKFGTAGWDWIVGSAFGEYIYGDALKLLGGRGSSDLIQGAGGDDTIIGDADEMHGAIGGEDILDGGSGDDHVYGDTRYLLGQSRGGNDVIYGGEGRDYLFGDSMSASGNSIGGSDEIFGGEGNEWSIVGDAGLMWGDAVGGSDRLEGGVGDDKLFGDADTMRDRARGGDDVIVGGSGNDIMFGDAETRSTGYVGEGGADRFLFDIGSGVDRIGDFETGKDLIQILPGYGLHDLDDLASHIHDDANGNAVIRLNGVVDEITLAGVSSASLSAVDFLFSDEIVRGSSGNNQINPTTSVAAYRTTGVHDAVFGMDGNDVIDGGGGADRMDGGAGNDTYFIDTYSSNGIAADDDQVIEAFGEGIDTVNAFVSYRLADNVENLTLLGSDPIDGSGNELDNLITGNSAANALEGALGNDRLTGLNGDDRLIGGDGDDWLDGGKGNDALKGDDGDDTLDGGSGKDSLTGGEGIDRFVFNFGDTAINSVRLDRVNDFNTGEDGFDLDFLNGSLAGSDYAEATITSNSFDDALALAQSMTSGGKTVVFIAGASDGWVFWDAVGGDGQLDQAVLLIGAVSSGFISANDFF